jgi:hypothetical protein
VALASVGSEKGESPQGHPGGFQAFHKEQQLGGSSRIAASFKIPFFEKYS